MSNNYQRLNRGSHEKDRDESPDPLVNPKGKEKKQCPDEVLKKDKNLSHCRVTVFPAPESIITSSSITSTNKHDCYLNIYLKKG